MFKFLTDICNFFYQDFVLFFLVDSQMIRQGKYTRNFGPETRHYYRQCLCNECLKILQNIFHIAISTSRL